MSTLARLSFFALFLISVGCARSTPGSTLPGDESADVEDLSGMRITTGDDGLELYDAETLFQRARAASREGDCAAAVALYDQVVSEFPGSRYASPSLYNAALCLTREEDPAAAAAHYERLVRDYPESGDVRPARFQLAELYEQQQRWDDLIRVAESLLEDAELSPDDRVESMARRAQGLLGRGERGAAARQSRDTLMYARRGDGRVSNMGFIAAANFVLAETHRLDAEEVRIPEGDQETQRQALEARSRHMLDAQRAYFDTMRWTDPEWTAAAGYRIGSMYDRFWQEIMTAPVPPAARILTAEEQADYDRYYREELERFVQPLLRHSVRYFELTLRMIERTGVDTEWRARIEADLERVRARLLRPIEEPAQAAQTP